MVSITIRDVPQETRNELAARAARSGRSLQEYLRGIELYPFGDRIWELRDNLTAYDAWYVALAEGHDCPLATLDQRIVASVGPRCEFVTFDG